MFEEYTEEYFLKQARAMGQELGVDTRQGSVYMDAAAGHCLRAAKFYSDLSQTFDMLALDTCAGDVLNEKAAERNLDRKMATASYYHVDFVGMSAKEMLGKRFMAGGYYFVLSEYDDGIYLKAEMDGMESNALLSGISVIPVNNIAGLQSATLGELYLAGTDMEDDESFRLRLKEMITHKAENGNKQQYKAWCESIEGVGKAVIYPLAYGANTVKGVILSSEGTAPTDALINDVQEYIDPGSAGTGEGMAPIGCHFFAVAAVEVDVDVSLDAVLRDGYSKDSVMDEIRQKLGEYLKWIALNADEADMVVIQYIRMVAIMADISGLQDIYNMHVNGGMVNVSIPAGHVGVLGEVLINVDF